MSRRFRAQVSLFRVLKISTDATPPLGVCGLCDRMVMETRGKDHRRMILRDSREVQSNHLPTHGAKAAEG